MDITLVPGQQVVWLYRPLNWPHPRIPVDAEIVQVSQLRIRIRIRTPCGEAHFRWVHPKNLRPKMPDEPEYLYPEVR